MEFAHDPLFRLYAAASIVLCFLLGALGLLTAMRRGKYGSPSTPEDATALRIPAEADADHPEVARALRAHRNALETIPVFYALGLLLVLARGNLTGGAICFAVFVVARILHAVFYFRAVQPARSIAFLTGQLALIALAAQVVREIV